MTFIFSIVLASEVTVSQRIIDEITSKNVVAFPTFIN